MTNCQLQARLEAHQAMIGEYISRMSPIAGDDGMLNTKLRQMLNECEREIDRLTRTLEVRRTAEIMRTAQ